MSAAGSADRLADLDALLPQDHQARLVLDCVSRSALMARITAAGGGSKSAVPYFALWLFAVFRGIGSAADLAWHCQHGVGFRWLSVGLDVDAKSLLSYRTIGAQAVDELLAEHLTVLRSSEANSGGEENLLAGFGEALRLVIELRKKLAEPLDNALERRKSITDERRKIRSTRGDQALDQLKLLAAARQAEAKRLDDARQRELAEKAKSPPPRIASKPSASAPGRYSSKTSLAWTMSDGAEGRFKRILSGTLAVFAVLSVALFLIKPPPVERAKETKVPERLTQLFEDQRTKAKIEKPKVIETVKPKAAELSDLINPGVAPAEVAVVAKAEPKIAPSSDSSKAVKPMTAEVAAARERASQTGLAAMKDQFAALRQLSGGDAFRQDQVSAGAGGFGSGSAIGGASGSGTGQAGRDLIGRAATAGSGGVAGASIAYAGGGSLGGRATTKIQGPAGAPSIAQVEKEAKSGKRSAEDIRLAFDAHKSAIYSIYRRALRNNPLLEGRVVLKLSIEPAGKVTACSIVSSALKDPDLEEKLIARVMLIDFGSRPGSESWTGNYQIDFVPSS